MVTEIKLMLVKDIQKCLSFTIFIDMHIIVSVWFIFRYYQGNTLMTNTIKSV